MSKEAGLMSPGDLAQEILGQLQVFNYTSCMLADD
jgi:hypothetical protein